MRIFLFFLVFLSQIAQAKIHIEPYVGYSVMSPHSDVKSAKEDLGSLVQIQERLEQANEIFLSVLYGYSGGLRLGYSSLGLAFGADLTLSHFNKSFRSTSNGDFRIKRQFLLPGVFASYKLPLLFRAYGSFIPIGYIKTELDEDKVYSCKSYGFKTGISYLSLPFVSINFEYQALKEKEEENSTCGKGYHTLSAFLNIIF